MGSHLARYWHRLDPFRPVPSRFLAVRFGAAESLRALGAGERQLLLAGRVRPNCVPLSLALCHSIISSSSALSLSLSRCSLAFTRRLAFSPSENIGRHQGKFESLLSTSECRSVGPRYQPLKTHRLLNISSNHSRAAFRRSECRRPSLFFVYFSFGS